jgi:hypothetical protein
MDKGYASEEIRELIRDTLLFYYPRQKPKT